MKLRARFSELWRGIYVAVLLLCIAAVATAQDTTTAFSIENVNAELQSLEDVSVTGEVVNHLPWKVQDVEVTVSFQDGEQEHVVTDTISRIASNRSGGFKVNQRIQNLMTARYSLGITDFTILNPDVTGLLEWFALSESGLVRTKIIEAFNAMTDPAALQGLEDCVEFPISHGRDMDKVIEDMLCLNGLYALQSPESVDALLTLVARYSDAASETEEGDLGLMFSIGLEAPNSLLQVMALKQMVPTDETLITTVDLVEGILRQLEPQSWPHLLRAAASEDAAIAEAARQMIDRLDLHDVRRMLAMEDADLLEEMIGALGEAHYEGAVIPLTEAAIARPALRDAVTDSLVAMGKDAVPDLVTALRHTDVAVADYAEALMKKHADRLAPALNAAFLAQAPNTPIPTSGEAVVTALRQNAEAHILAETEPLFMQSMADYQGGDCLTAAEGILEMLRIRNQTPFAVESASILFCAAQMYEESRDYEHAIRLGKEAYALRPGDAQIGESLAAWLTVLGDRETNPLQAARLYRTALGYDAEAPNAYQALGTIILKHNVIYVLMGLGLLAIGFGYAFMKPGL
jgi:tetratricopeptide (TPR) repeat protein